MKTFNRYKNNSHKTTHWTQLLDEDKRNFKDEVQYLEMINKRISIITLYNKKMEMKLLEVYSQGPVVFTFSIGTLEIKAFCEPNYPLSVEKANYQLSLDDFEIYQDTKKVLEKLSEIYPKENFEKMINDTVNYLFVKFYNQMESLSQNFLATTYNFSK